MSTSHDNQIRRDLLSELCIWYAPELALSPERFALHQPKEWPGLLAAIAELNQQYAKEAGPNPEIGWEQRLYEMQQIPYLGDTDLLGMLRPGEWYCHLPGRIFDGEALLPMQLGWGPTPEQAVLAAWALVEEVSRTGHFFRMTEQPKAHYYRWDGTQWIEYPPKS